MKRTTNGTNVFAHEFERDGKQYRLEAQFSCLNGNEYDSNNDVSLSFNLLEGRSIKYSDGSSSVVWKEYSGQDAKVFGAGEWFVSIRSMNEFIHANFKDEMAIIRKQIAAYVIDGMPQNCICD